MKIAYSDTIFGFQAMSLKPIGPVSDNRSVAQGLRVYNHDGKLGLDFALGSLNPLLMSSEYFHLFIGKLHSARALRFSLPLLARTRRRYYCRPHPISLPKRIERGAKTMALISPIPPLELTSGSLEGEDLSATAFDVLSWNPN